MKNRLSVFFTLLIFAAGFSENGYCSDGNAMSQLGFSNKNEMELIGGASAGDVEKVRNVLATGIDVNGKYGVMQQTALDMAANRGRLEMAKFLVDSGAHANNRGTLGWTPLMHAVNNGHIEVVKFLISRGADVNADPGRGGTVIQLAEKYPEIVQVLKDAGAKNSLPLAPETNVTLKAVSPLDERVFTKELGVLKVKGFIKWEDTTLTIKDSVAIWFQDKNKLEVFFFPFELTPQAVEALKRDPEQVPFELNQLKMSYDLLGSVAVYFEEGKEKSLESISRCALFIHDYSKQIPDASVNLIGSTAQNSFKKLLFSISGEEGEIVMSCVGEQGGKYSWDIKLRSKVFVKRATQPA